IERLLVMKKNSLTTIINLISCAALFATSMPAASVFAHDVEPPEAGEVNFQVMQLRNDRAEINKCGPIAGIVMSNVLMGRGLTMLVTGAVGIAQENRDQTQCEAENPDEPASFCEPWFHGLSAGAAAAGGLFLVTGAITTWISVKRLKERKAKQFELDAHIRELEARSTRVSVA